MGSTRGKAAGVVDTLSFQGRQPSQQGVCNCDLGQDSSEGKREPPVSACGGSQTTLWGREFCRCPRAEVRARVWPPLVPQLLEQL